LAWLDWRDGLWVGEGSPASCCCRACALPHANRSRCTFPCTSHQPACVSAVLHGCGISNTCAHRSPRAHAKAGEAHIPVARGFV